MMRLLLLFFLFPLTVSLDGVIFGVLELQLRSRSTTASQNEFLLHVLSHAGHFLDQIFQQEYKYTAFQFSHVTLAVNDFGIEQVSNAFNVFVNLQGTAMFETNTAPSKDMRQVATRALEERNTVFLTSLQSSQDPLLKNVTFAIVTIPVI